ncbi:hypothetical protein [Rhodanobacter sp. L36]|uniref:hypothetical protein n=1 Tax=Rhodanobacter sp. L36 TaxID=1747221 RepID=UPI0020B15D6B|nr:hypothetical protein [Rhodanobacter sp. L36]
MSRGRWRQPPLTRPALTLVLFAVLLLHALFALVLWHEMQPKPLHVAVMHDDIEQVLQVRLIDHSSPPIVHAPEPIAPPTLTPPRPTAPPRVRPITREKPHQDAMVVQDHEPPPAPATSAAVSPANSLFAKDGSVRLSPTQPAYAAASAKAPPAKPADDRQIMQHDTNRMHYKSTRFEKYFPPPSETAGGAVGRHVGDALKQIADSICDPHKISTASNMLCGAPPLPPGPKEGDERLNLPPASLVDDPNTPKPPLASCIAEYKATKPLSDGCPLNTPELAFKAEMRECIDLFRQGKRLKTWCPLDTPKRAAEESPQGASSSTGSH